MKALSVKQPWASLIATGHKTIETRTWKTNYRGPILICSSLQRDKVATAWWSVTYPSLSTSPVGVCMCTAELVDCRPMVDEDQQVAMCGMAPYAWVLANVKVVEPKPIKGKLGLYEVEWES